MLYFVTTAVEQDCMRWIEKNKKKTTPSCAEKVERYASWVSLLLVIQKKKIFFFVTVDWAVEDWKVHGWLREKIRELIPCLFSFCSLILTSRFISLWLPCLWQLLFLFSSCLFLSYRVVWHVSSSSSVGGLSAHMRAHANSCIDTSERDTHSEQDTPASIRTEVKWVHQHPWWIIELSGSVQK